MTQTVCLSMIVKDEERVLARCLASVRPLIDYWVIVDTGSTDATMRVARESLEGIPGELHERPWRDFGTNRTEALELARGKSDYLLFIDADEALVTGLWRRLPTLDRDQYIVKCRLDGSDTEWYRTTLARSAIPWRYEGVLHEFLTADVPHTTGRIEGLLIQSYSDGARNADARQKYLRDARVLEGAIKKEPLNARYVFYLAQSYRDAGDPARARDAYARRAEMGGWDEEVWYSLYQVAVLGEKAGRPWPETLAAYLNAFQRRPSRAEPLHDLARHYNWDGKHALAKLYARAAVAVPPTKDILFVDASIQRWRAQDELAIALYWLGEYEESAAISASLLERGVLPPSQVERVQKNLAFARDGLAPPTPSPPVPGTP